MEEYPQVRVTDAPGYADFDGWLMLTMPEDWPVKVSVVGFELDGKRDFAVIPNGCISMMPESIPEPQTENIRDLLQRIQVEQGWTDETLQGRLLDFLEEHVDPDTLRAYLAPSDTT